MKKTILALFLTFSGIAHGQYWQQSVDYTMDITMNVDDHQYDGYQKVQHQRSPSHSPVLVHGVVC